MTNPDSEQIPVTQYELAHLAILLNEPSHEQGIQKALALVIQAHNALCEEHDKRIESRRQRYTKGGLVFPEEAPKESEPA